MDICETEGVIMKIKDYYTQQHCCCGFTEIFRLGLTGSTLKLKISEEYGEMIACDNVACPIKWFYLKCMGLTAAPAGRWLCPDCEDSNR